MDKNDHIHLIGIGGSGLSAIARVLHESGYAVSGSDQQLSPLALALLDAGVPVSVGHHPGNVNGATIVVRSSAIPDDNPEVLRAWEKGLPVYKRSEFLGELMRNKQVVAIAGTHGKTTTTAMTAWVFSALGLDPSFIVGGVIHDLGVNAHAGTGPHFVIEADEYDRMFLGLTPDVAVITNVEHDHPDCFPTEADFWGAFRDFSDRIRPGGQLWACGDDLQALALSKRVLGQGLASQTYGLEDRNDLQARNLDAVRKAGYAFEIYHAGRKLTASQLKIPGRHNVQNALAVIGICLALEIDVPAAAEALSQFTGAGRRFEVRGEAEGVLVVDDYAHHPTEIRVTLEAARQQYPERPLWVVWQPHTFSRLQILGKDFASAFRGAERVYVTSVYAARETQPVDFSLADLVASISKEVPTRHIPGLAEMAASLVDELPSGVLLLVLSAGDGNQVGARVLETLQGKESEHAGE